MVHCDRARADARNRSFAMCDVMIGDGAMIFFYDNGADPRVVNRLADSMLIIRSIQDHNVFTYGLSRRESIQFILRSYQR